MGSQNENDDLLIHWIRKFYQSACFVIDTIELPGALGETRLEMRICEECRRTSIARHP